MKTILLLEDDKNLNHGIALKLRKEGFQVLSSFGVSQAEEIFRTSHIDLLISDITLDDGNGLEFCEKIREKSNVYILFLTALDSELDMVNAYDIGADDYITKPFSLTLLVSKVHAFMRRIDGTKRNTISSAGIEILYSEMKAYRNGALLPLSKKEIQLLLFLLEHARQIVSKEQILEHVWDVEGQFVDENTVPVNISRLRGKVGSDCIENVRGMGYIWVKESIKE
ncbi:response regulator transcription factor [Lachnospiraceae bacterium LCP25S3_G4]